MERNDVLRMLESDLETLMKKRSTMINTNDYRPSIDVTRVIKDTLELLDKYGWQQMYSIYKLPDANNPEKFIDMISVWEQNSQGKIKNCRCFQLGVEYVPGVN